jgi:ribosomal protein L11 methylase PrmA
MYYYDDIRFIIRNTLTVFLIFFLLVAAYLVWKYWALVIGAGYDPTPRDQVTRLLGLAGTGEKDTVYDLGCGDGRLLIAAVRDFGAYAAVGIEADPIRYLITRYNVRKAGLENRIKILFGNFFSKPIQEATIVTLFLYQPVNNRLKAKFRRELRKGTRIVSYMWKIDDWEEKGTLSQEGLFLYRL